MLVAIQSVSLLVCQSFGGVSREVLWPTKGLVSGQAWKMLIIGLTGGICSGKSTIARLLRDSYNLPLIDADLLGHNAYAKGTDCYNKLRDTFGDQIINSDTGEVDRKMLGSIVFSSAEQMAKLNEIVWPEIRALIISALDLHRQSQTELVVLEAAVMIEAGWQDLVDSLWVVAVSSEVATQRLIKRNNLSVDQAKSRVAAQMGVEERVRHADMVIWNEDEGETSLEALRLKVAEMLHHVKSKR